MVYYIHVRKAKQLSMSPSYLLVIPIATLWPLVALGVTFVRFGGLPGDSEQVAAAVLGFLLLGVISGFVLISLLRRMANRQRRVFTIIGYGLAAPFGYVSGIVGPLTLEAFSVGGLPAVIYYFLLFPLAIAFYGSLPPICGAAAGLLIGGIRDRSS
jgi:hypothetical protein